MLRLLVIVVTLLCVTVPGQAQVDQGQVGAWYMFMWSHENTETGFGVLRAARPSTPSVTPISHPAYLAPVTTPARSIASIRKH